ncbi:MAG: ATP-binding protein, partial [Anaerolineae bacterium]
VEQITGYPPEHFMQGVAAWLNTIHPEDKARIEANYARELAGEAMRHEYRIIRPDGAVRWLYGKVSPTLDETGQVMRLDGVVSDITERKQAEDRLARLNACFLNFGPDPLANINQLTALCGELLDADCALYNRLHQGMLCSWGQWQTPPGYNPVDQPEGHICYDVIKQPKDDVVIIRNLAATAYAETDPNVKPFNLQTYIGKAVQLQEETAVGSLCVVYQRDFVPGDNDIQLMTLISGAIAIEERRKGARDSLKETQEHLAATLDALPDLLFEVGRDGRFYDFRAPDLDLLFVPPEMFLGKMVTEVLPPEAAAIIMDAIEQTAAGRQHIGAIYAFDMPIGKRWFEASMAAKGDLTTEDGRIIALSRDITQRVMAEDSLRKRTKQLETTLTKLKETQAQLVQQERLAAVGQLAAGIAHDFNNLMATILLYSDLLLQSNKLNTKEQEKISVIYRQGQRAAHLTQQILDFSRKTIMEKKRLNLFLFLEDLISLLDRTLPENIHLRLSGEEETSFVYADPTRLEQVMMNLAINARNAMPNGGQLHIDLKQITVSEGGPPHPLGLTAGAWHQIRVSDTGVGIEPDILPRIFEPFFTTRAPLGSGLGLSQVYGIIKQLGGEVDVTSPPGQGATFTLFLPVMTATQQEIQPVGLAVATEGNGETLLVVEDDDHLRKALTESLTALNYQVISARNGRDALKMYHQHKNEIALILSDLVMPDMGGLELVQILKQNHTDLEVLIISGYPFADIKKDLKAAGVTNWLQKPLNLQSLGQTVSGILETKDQS